MIATRAERTCQRKTRQTSATTMHSSMSFSRKRGNGALNQLARGRRPSPPARQQVARARISASFLFDAIDHRERIFAIAHDDDSSDDFALPSSSATPRRKVRTEMDLVPTFFTQTGRPVSDP